MLDGDFGMVGYQGRLLFHYELTPSCSLTGFLSHCFAFVPCRFHEVFSQFSAQTQVVRNPTNCEIPYFYILFGD